MEIGPLSLVVFAPLAAALALLATGARLPEAVWRVFGFAAMAATFALSVPLWTSYDLVEGGYQLVEHVSWIEAAGAHWFVGIDGISLVLVLLTTFLMPIAMLVSWGDVRRDARSYVFFMLLLETGILGAFVSLNLFVFYLFCELLLIPTYFVIGIWGGPRRIRAATRFLLMSMGGSLLMLLALLVLARLGYEQSGGVVQLDWVPRPGIEGFALVDTRVPLLGQAAWWRTQPVLFCAFALAFAVRIPVFPFHTWLPDAQAEAPSGGSLVLAALLLKVGSYGLLRFALPLFPNAVAELAGVAGALVLAGIVHASLIALVQADLKRVVAYASVAQMGLVVLGLFAMNSQGLTGSVLQMVSHGLAIAALCALTGFLCERRQTQAIAELGGVARPMPIFAVMFGVALLSSAGLPLLAGFVGEVLILLGTFGAFPWLAVGATAGSAVMACALVWTYRKMMFGPVDNPENRALIDLGLRERLIMVALVVPIIGLGVHPDPVLRRIEPSVVHALRLMEARTVVDEDVAPEEAVAVVETLPGAAR